MSVTPSMMDFPLKSHAGVSRSGLDGREIEQLIRHLEPCLQTLGDASILLTGATGWFGTWLLDVLTSADEALKLGLHVTCVSRDPERFLARFEGFRGDPRITWIKSDVRYLEPCAVGFSHIIHAATDSSQKSDQDTPGDQFDTIVDGTRRVLAVSGSRCRSFLLLSSGAIYGPAYAGSAHFVEGRPGGPDPSVIRSGYAEGKRVAEYLCAVAAGLGVPTRIARCFAFAGPHMPFHKHFAIGNFIADAVAGRTIRVRSDGRPLRSYMYMTDLIRALLVILVEGSVARPYNVGSEEAISIEQLARCVDRIVGGRGVSVEGVASEDHDCYVPDTARLRTELHYNSTVNLDDTIARTAAWYRERGAETRPSCT